MATAEKATAREESTQISRGTIRLSAVGPVSPAVRVSGAPPPSPLRVTEILTIFQPYTTQGLTPGRFFEFT